MLYTQIKGEIEREISAVAGTKKFSRLVVFVGNGMTRSAAAMSPDARDPSWMSWLQTCLREAKASQSLDYLQESLHYSLDQVLSYVMSLPKINPQSVWKALWDKTITIERSPAHEAILEIADAVITTNYDDLFEYSRNGSWRSRNLLHVAADKSRTGKNVWKIHGSFPVRAPRGDAENDLRFRNFIAGAAADTAAMKEKYEEVAIQIGQKQFDRIYRPVISELAREETLVLFVGAGLGGEELIISRLLAAARGGDRQSTWISLEVAESLDPLHKLKRFGIHPCRVPAGLAGSSQARVLACLAALECYASPKLSNTTEEIRKGWHEVLRSQVNSQRFVVDASRRHLTERLPVVVSVGQCAWNRVVGVEAAIGQEGAYAPRIGSWKPVAGTATAGEKEEVLLANEVGGQALVPTLIWDALGIPSALVSTVWDDRFGQQILSELQRRNWLDSTGVQQLSGQKETAGRRETDNNTIVAWYGLRSIIDSSDRSGSSGSISKKGLAMLGADVPFVYLTKDNWVEATKKLDRRTKKCRAKLVVFETGGAGGKLGAEVWTAYQGGVVIASVESALGWHDLETRKAWARSPAESKDRAMELAEAADGVWWRANNARRHGKVKDDRERFFMTVALLDKVKSQPVPKFLNKGALSGLKMYAITLGELGILYWIKEGDTGRWSQPQCSASRAVLKGRRALRFSEIRNGTECGDVLRAGFLASLVLTSGWATKDTTKIESPQLLNALSWGNWFGLNKMKFFALGDYLEFVKNECGAAGGQNLVRRMLKGRPRDANGAEEFPHFDVIEGQEFSEPIVKWRDRVEHWLEDGRDAFQAEIKRWYKARGLNRP